MSNGVCTAQLQHVAPVWRCQDVTAASRLRQRVNERGRFIPSTATGTPPLR